MKKTKLILSLILLLIACKYAVAQDMADKFKTNLISPSPTAAGLGRYGQIPVTMYMGQANVSVPLFNVEGRDIKLPIDLSYNYTGMRPLEQSSWIGMGWSLQAGGVITVNVRGLPDGTADGGKNYDDLEGSITTLSTNNTVLKSINDFGSYDLEPDLYSFNFGNYSGKFIRVKGEFYCLPANKFKVSGSPANGFTIITEDGTRYLFDVPEITTQQTPSSGVSFGAYNSAFYLSKITSASGAEQISLSYVNEDRLYQPGILSQTYDRLLSLPPDGSPYMKTRLYPMQGSMLTKVDGVRLSSIVSDRYKVFFNVAITPRQDIGSVGNYFYALDNIRVQTSDDMEIKKIDFRHGYFQGGPSKALKLNAVVNYNLGITTDSLVHSFEYEGSGMPLRSQTVGIDHYGFYNGIPASTLIPKYVLAGPDTTFFMENGANREPVFTAAESGALKKIYYPTGGYSTFEYENNSFETSRISPSTGLPYTFDAYGIRIKRIIDYPLYGQPLTTSYSYAKGVTIGAPYTTKMLKEYVSTGMLTYVWLDHFQLNSTLAEMQDFGTPYYYQQVTVEKGLGTNDVTRTIYHYDRFDDRLTYAGIREVERTMYKKAAGAFIAQAKVSTAYSLKTDKVFIGAKFPYLETINAPIENFKSDLYDLAIGWLLPSSTVETNYDGDSLKITTDYIYDTTTHNLRLVYQNKSNGGRTIEKFKYPEDYSTPVEVALRNANIVAPVEKQLWSYKNLSDSVLVNSLINVYDGLSFKPASIYEIKNPGAIQALNNETRDFYGKYNTVISDTRFEKKIDFTYDGYAKLVRQRKDLDRAIGYKWGYMSSIPAAANAEKNYNYPTAEAQNATELEYFIEDFEDQQLAATGNAHTGKKYFSGNAYTVNFQLPNSRKYVISYWYLSGGKWRLKPEQPYQSNFFVLSDGDGYDDIRIYPSDSQVTTYTYELGKGISSITDAKSQVNYYTYDNFNRLLNIENQNHEIVRNYRYNLTNIAPVWSNVGAAFCVVDLSGNYTGEQKIVQTDTNPASPSYGTSRNFSLGNNGLCSTPAFAKLVLYSSNSITTSGYTMTRNVYKIKLFSDINCSIPFNAVSATNVGYRISYITSFGSGDPDVAYDSYGFALVPAGANSSAEIEVFEGCSPPIDVQARGELPGEDPQPSSSCTAFTFWILAGSGYLPKN